MTSSRPSTGDFSRSGPNRTRISSPGLFASSSGAAALARFIDSCQRRPGEGDQEEAGSKESRRVPFHDCPPWAISPAAGGRMSRWSMIVNGRRFVVHPVPASPRPPPAPSQPPWPSGGWSEGSPAVRESAFRVPQLSLRRAVLQVDEPGQDPSECSGFLRFLGNLGNRALSRIVTKRGSNSQDKGLTKSRLRFKSKLFQE